MATHKPPGLLKPLCEGVVALCKISIFFKRGGVHIRTVYICGSSQPYRYLISRIAWRPGGYVQ